MHFSFTEEERTHELVLSTEEERGREREKEERETEEEEDEDDSTEESIAQIHVTKIKSNE